MTLWAFCIGAAVLAIIGLACVEQMGAPGHEFTDVDCPER